MVHSNTKKISENIKKILSPFDSQIFLLKLDCGPFVWKKFLKSFNMT